MKYIRIFIFLFVSAGIISSCTDLDVEPKDLATSDIVFQDPAQYGAFVAKIYAGLAVTGQQGTNQAGDPDIKDIDEGFSSYLRNYWNMQQLPTDESITAWTDNGIEELQYQTWTSSNPMTSAMFSRVFFQVSLANEFLKESTEVKLEERGLLNTIGEEVELYRAEVRYLRALSYWHGLDFFRNVPLYTEDQVLGELPQQASPQETFEFIESELRAIESILPAPGTAVYGRADQAAAWALLAKLYMNAEVYTGQDRYTDALTYINNIVNSGAYNLQPEYSHLFLTDNNTSPEVIFPIVFDGNYTRSFGGMTFLVSMAIGGSMDPADYGMAGGWWGMRARSPLPDKFTVLDGDIDSRSGLFVDNGRAKRIDNVTDFTEGIAVVKYRNVSSSGEPGKDAGVPDTDFPMFRLADFYLLYAEAVLRGGSGGSTSQAVDYINEIRERAYGDQSGNISEGDLDLDFIINERSRELYWEAHRRTDLIRFNMFSENGIWPWKGQNPEGTTTAPFRDYYPIPSNQINANPNLEQNDGY